MCRQFNQICAAADAEADEARKRALEQEGLRLIRSPLASGMRMASFGLWV